MLETGGGRDMAAIPWSVDEELECFLIHKRDSGADLSQEVAHRKAIGAVPKWFVSYLIGCR